jgi:hypothetical protein
MKPAIKPNASDLKFHKDLQKVMQLDKQIQPAVNGIYRHLCQVLESERDRELFQLFVILQTGADLSLYAPRYVLSMEMILGDYIEIYTTWAKRAEELLQAMETGKAISKPGARRKSPRRASGRAGNE